MEMQQEPSGEKQGNITAPEQEGGAWATACPQGARVQKQPFLEQITDAKALGEQSPGSFSALSHPFSGGDPVHQMYRDTLKTWGGLMIRGTSCFKLGLVYFSIR